MWVVWGHLDMFCCTKDKPTHILLWRANLRSTVAQPDHSSDFEPYTRFDLVACIREILAPHPCLLQADAAFAARRCLCELLREEESRMLL